MDDHELAAGVASGNPEAIARFVDRFYPAVFRFLWHSTGSREDAEDLASQALLRARMDIRKFRSDGALAAWMFSVARREFLRFRRRQVLFSMFVAHTSPKQEPPQNEDVVIIQLALAQLPPKLRTAFLLTEVEGLTTEEAATALEVPAGTVKSRCFHAKKRLRTILGPAYPEVSNHAQPISE